MDYFAAQRKWTRRKLGGDSSRNSSAHLTRALSPDPATRALPCISITSAIHPDVATYLSRATGGSGGSRAVYKIAQEQFGKTYSVLSDAQKYEVDLLHRHEKMWCIHYTVAAVFATD